MESPNPFGADAPAVDYVGLAFRALACAIFLGLALNLATLGGVRTLQRGQPPSNALDFSSGPAIMLLAGLLISCFAAGLTCWFLLAPVRNAYRQGMLAMIAFFGSFVLASVGMPLDQILGRNGLFVGAAAALLIAGILYRAIKRLPAAQ